MARLARQLALVVALGAAPLLLLEGGLRLAGWPTDRVRSFGKLLNYDLQVWNETIGVFRPNARTTVMWPPELSYEAHINSLGLRGPEIERTPPPGRTRILALGDSMTFSYYLEEDETWPARLEALLRADGADVEVVNGGSGGWSIVSSVRFFEERASALEPHHVLLAFCANDIADLERPETVYDATKRHATSGGGELSRALRTTALFELQLRATVGWRELREKWFGEKHRPLTSMDVPAERADALWRTYAEWVNRLHALLDARGAELTLVYLPDAYKIAEGLPADDEERLRAIARERGLRFVSPLPAFEGRPDTEFFNQPRDAHFNAKGAELVAQALARELRGRFAAADARGGTQWSRTTSR